MARTPGSRNKAKKITDVIDVVSNEDELLAELVHGKAKWAAKAKENEEAGKACVNELEYSRAYKLLLNQFTKMDD